MIRGEKVGLRARQPSDVAVLHAEVYDDVATQIRAAGKDNRGAHIGISLRPGAGGRGLGTDTVRTLCHYGFAVRPEPPADRDAGRGMIRAATAAGFALEGTLRGAAWVLGEFADEVIYGLLAEDWRSSAAA
jgi:RimJ/RimL family protein N-acetyltransferase